MQIVGGLAIVGVLVLVALTLWPQSEPSTTVVVQSSEDSVLGSPAPGMDASVTTAPTSSPEPSPTTEAEETATPTSESDEPASDEASLPEERRGEVRVLVLNAGAPDGAAGLVTGSLAEQGFQPANPENAAAPSEGIRVLHAAEQRDAGLAVGMIVGAEADQVQQANPDDPSWAAFGTDLDVLVILGPPLP